jgi:hypothetical protein
VAEALGGKAQQMGFGRIFIGKESIKMLPEFFKEKYAAKIIDDASNRAGVDKEQLILSLEQQVLP